MIWEALGGTEDIPLVTVGLLLAFICQADFDATAAFVFWLLDTFEQDIPAMCEAQQQEEDGQAAVEEVSDQDYDKMYRDYCATDDIVL